VPNHSASLNLDIRREGVGYNNSQIYIKQLDHLVVVELDICVQVASDNRITFVGWLFDICEESPYQHIMRSSEQIGSVWDVKSDRHVGSLLSTLTPN
jgi:hypothetical protein